MQVQCPLSGDMGSIPVGLWLDFARSRGATRAVTCELATKLSQLLRQL